jgi:predicted Zn-dependent protease
MLFRVNRLIPLAAAVLIAMSAAGSASAAVYKWPSRQIRVCDRSGYTRNVVEAVSWWNRTPSRVHLHRSCQRPQIVIVRYSRATPNVAGTGEYPPGGKVRLNHYWMRKLPRVQRADIVGHEVGHALGLPHIAGCALMFGGSGFGADCHVPPDREPCGPQRHDVRELIRRYGGQLGDFRGFTCPDSLYYP